MTIKSIQTVIKVGSSLAVTIPAKEARYYDIKAGEQLEVSYSLPETSNKDVDAVEIDMQKLNAEYEVFKKKYHQTLKNLASR